MVPPLPDWTTLFELDPLSPLTVYVNVTELDDVFAGIVSVHVFDEPVTDLPPVTDVFAPQLVETLTVPPEAGNDVGLTLIEQEPVVVPGDVQLTVMLPELSADAVNDVLVQVSVAAWTGIGARMKPLEATAAASARLMVR